jgi:hypothetical protein
MTENDLVEIMLRCGRNPWDHPYAREWNEMKDRLGVLQNHCRYLQANNCVLLTEDGWNHPWVFKKISQTQNFVHFCTQKTPQQVAGTAWSDLRRWATISPGLRGCEHWTDAELEAFRRGKMADYSGRC